MVAKHIEIDNIQAQQPMPDVNSILEYWGSFLNDKIKLVPNENIVKSDSSHVLGIASRCPVAPFCVFLVGFHLLAESTMGGRP